MPCNAVTQQTVKADVNLGFTMRNQQAINTLKAELEKVIGPVEIRANDWRYDAWDHNKMPIDRVESFWFVSEKATVYIDADGNIQLRQGALRYKHELSPEQLQPIVTAIVQRVNGLAYQTTVRQLISRNAKIKSQQVASNGALVLNVEI
jgi:hypothetical protein